MSLGIFQATIVDEFGNVQAGAEIQVFDESTGLLAELFSDKLGTALDNPFFTTSDGFAEFYANNGEYRISAVKGLFSRTWRYVQIGDTAQRDTGTDFDQVPLNTNIVYPVDTVADLRLLEPTVDGQQFNLLEYNTGTGLGGGSLYYDASDTTSADDGGSVFVTATGERIKRVFSTYPTADMFGVVHDGSDESVAMQSAIDWVSQSDFNHLITLKEVKAQIILKSNCIIHGAGMFAHSIKAPDGWTSGNVVDSYLFDTYKFTDSDDSTPENCGLFNISIDGNHENFSGTASATTGAGLRIAVIRPFLKNVRVVGAPGIGIHTGLKGITRTDTDWFRTQTKLGSVDNIKVFGCLNDGVVWDGAIDEYVGSIEVGVCGWPDTSFSASRPSLIEPTRRVCGLSVNGTAEFGWIHTFGIKEGYGVIVGTPSYGSGTLRFKADTIISESSNCGIWTRNGARYQISKLDIHNNYGYDDTPQWLDDGSGLQGTVDNLEAISSVNSSGQDIVRLVGDSKTVASAFINGASASGDALVVGGFNNKINADITGASTGILILSTATQWSINARVGACDVGSELEVGGGSAINSNISALFGNTADFIGFDSLNSSERSQILLESKTGTDKKSRLYSGVSSDVSADSTSLKTVNIPINAVFAPLPEDVSLSVQYVSGASPDYSQCTIAGTTITASQIQAYIKFDSTGTGVVKLSASVS